MEPLLSAVLVVLGALLIVGLATLFLLIRRPPQEIRTAVLAERLSRLEPVANAVNGIQLGLAELQAYTKARQDLEQRTAESIRRLESVIAGTRAKGIAGENIVEEALSRLPPDWQVRNFRVGNRVVEFGLRLPNNLVIPIDSKWPATPLLERFAMCDDPEQQRRLKARITAVTLEKAREVGKYVDPNITAGFGIAAVPDAVYHLCWGAQAELVRSNVVLLSYGMLIPYLLLVFQTVLKASRSMGLERLDAYLRSTQDSIDALREELEGRLSRAITMLSNSRNDMSVHLSRINSSLTSLQVSDSSSGGAASNGARRATDGDDTGEAP